MLSIVDDADVSVHPVADEGRVVDLDELRRLAAREMIAVALEAKRRAYLDAHADERDVDGRRAGGRQRLRPAA